MDSLISTAVEPSTDRHMSAQNRTVRVASLLSDTLREARDELQDDPTVSLHDRQELDRQLTQAVMRREVLKQQMLRYPRP